MFGKQLRKLRNKQGISAKTLGGILGIPQTTISNWENLKSEPNYESLIKIANYFNVTVDYLVGNDNEENKNEISRLAKELFDELNSIPQPAREKIEIGLIEYLHFLGYQIKRTQK